MTKAEPQHKPAHEIVPGEWILRDVPGGKQWQQVVAKEAPQPGYIRFNLHVVGYFDIWEALPLEVPQDTVLEWWRA